MKKRRKSIIVLLLFFVFLSKGFSQVVVRDSVEVRPLQNNIRFEPKIDFKQNIPKKAFQKSAGLPFNILSISGTETIQGYCSVYSFQYDVVAVTMKTPECYSYYFKIEGNPTFIKTDYNNIKIEDGRLAYGFHEVVTPDYSAWFYAGIVPLSSPIRNFCESENYDPRFSDPVYSCEEYLQYEEPPCISFFGWRHNVRWVYDEIFGYWESNSPEVEILDNDEGYKIIWPAGASLTFLKIDNQYLHVTTNPIYLSQNQISSIFVNMKDRFGKEVKMSYNTPFYFMLEGEYAEYGSFITPEGDITEFVPAVSYGKAKRGEVKFIADGITPDEMTEIKIRVIPDIDDFIEGIGELYIQGDNHFFQVTAEPAVIDTFEVTQIYIQAKNSSGVNIDISDETLIEIKLLPDREDLATLGYLKNIQGTPSASIAVPYSEASTGQVVYYADFDMNTDYKDIQLYVFDNDKTMFGDGSIRVGPEKILDHFEVDIEPDTINHTGLAGIIVQAKDEEDNDYNLADNTRLNIYLNGVGMTYGAFEADTLELSLQNVTYHDAHLGKFKYIANGIKPDSNITVNIKVEKMDDEGIFGASDLIIYGSKMDHFHVYCEPDTIQNMEKSVIKVTAMDEKGNKFDLADTTLLVLAIDSVGQFCGNLLAPDSTISEILKDIAYSDARQGRVKYLANGEIPDSTVTAKVVVFHSEDPEKMGWGEVVIKEEGLNGFSVTCSPDTIFYSDTTHVTVTPVQSNSQTLSISDTLKMNITLNDNGQKFGSLLAGNGQNVKRLDGIQYCHIKDAALKYIANDKMPALPTQAKIYAKLASDTTISGQDSVLIKNKYELTIEIPDSAQIWPTLPENDGGNPNRRNIQDSIKVEFKKNKKPLKEQNVTVSVRMILPSGGHDHTNQPPDNLKGRFSVLGKNKTSLGRITTETDTTGKIFLNYRAPEFSGSFELKAEKILHAGTEYVDKLRALDTLEVQVPNLVELGNGQGVYELVGAPSNHAGTNDPCRPDAPTSQHNNNHFGTQDLIDAITEIAVSYYSLHPAVRLRINDMSLESGGLFDIHNNWNDPHNRHKIGINVDIGLNGINLNNQCIQINQIHLNQIIDDFAVRIIEGDHYHITTN